MTKLLTATDLRFYDLKPMRQLSAGTLVHPVRLGPPRYSKIEEQIANQQQFAGWKLESCSPFLAIAQAK